MNFGSALQAIVAVFRTRADELLPVYFLSPAITGITRVVTFAGVAAAYIYLEITGRLAEFRAELRATDREPPGPEADIKAYEQWLQEVGPAFEILFPETVRWLLAATVLLSVAVFVVLYALAKAAQLACCRATLNDRSGTEAAIVGARRYGPTLLGLVLLEVLVIAGIVGLAAVPVIGVGVVSPAAAVGLGLLVVLVAVVAIVVVRVVFVFAAVAAVVDDRGVRAALGGSAGFIRANVPATLGYLGIVFGILGVVGSVSALFGSSNGPVAAVFGFTVVSPTLDLFKTALYGDHAGTVSPPSSPEIAVSDQLRGGLARGLRTLRGFVIERPGLNAFAGVLLVGGAVLGWLAAAPYEGLVTASIEARLEDNVPPTAAANFAANNTAVAVSSAVSGLAVGLPAAVSLLFNGTLLGALGRLEAAPIELAAFVIPHGLIEIPALVVAGALGLSLGGTGWRALRGRIGRRAFADAVEEAFWVLVGVAVLLAVAGLIEGFVSPYYYRPFV